MKIADNLPPTISAMVEVTLKVTGRVIFSGSTAHVLEPYVVTRNGQEFISLNRFDPDLQLAAMEALAVEAREREMAAAEGPEMPV